MDTPTIIETGKNCDNGNCWGGNAWGAGAGAFIGSLFGNGGWGGWGNGRYGAGQVGADVALQTGLQNLSDQVHNNGLSGLQSANGVQQAVSSAAAGVTGGIYQNALSNLQGQNGIQMQVANTGAALSGGMAQQTISNLQGQNAQNVSMLQGFAGVGQQMCCSTGRLSQEIDAAGDGITAALTNSRIQDMQNAQLMSDRLCGLNQNVTNQGYEGRLQNQSLAAQLAAQHADLKATIQQENCQDRELMRQIADQQVRDKLVECQNELAAQKAQNNLTGQLQSQTLYLISQLKPAAATGA